MKGHVTPSGLGPGGPRSCRKVGMVPRYSAIFDWPRLHPHEETPAGTFAGPKEQAQVQGSLSRQATPGLLGKAISGMLRNPHAAPPPTPRQDRGGVDR